MKALTWLQQLRRHPSSEKSTNVLKETTELHKACAAGNKDLIREILITNLSDMLVENELGKTPLQLYSTFHYEHVTHALPPPTVYSPPHDQVKLMANHHNNNPNFLLYLFQQACKALNQQGHGNKYFIVTGPGKIILFDTHADCAQAIENYANNAGKKVEATTTSLHSACAAGNANEIRKILEQGEIDVLALDPSGKSALKLYCAWYTANVDAEPFIFNPPVSTIKEISELPVDANDLHMLLFKHMCIAYSNAGHGNSGFLLDSRGELTIYSIAKIEYDDNGSQTDFKTSSRKSSLRRSNSNSSSSSSSTH